MARNRDDLADSLNTEASRGLFGLVAEDEDLDRRALWRLGSWAVGSIAALVLAILVSQSSIQGRQDQQVAADLARQSQQIQRLTKEAQAEVTRLGAAIETLNGDRDRLFSRVTVVEQNLESVTGSIARQAAAFKPQTPSVPTATSEPPPAASPAQPGAKPATPPATVPAEIIEGLQKSSRDALPRSPPTAPAGPTAAPIAVPSVAAPAAVPAAALPPVEASPARTMAEAPPKPLVEQSPAPAKPAAQVLISKSMLAPPDPAAGKLLEPPPQSAAAAPQAADGPAASAPGAPPVPAPAPAALPVVASTAEPETPPVAPPPAIPARRSEFGIDLGGANSLDGLRTIWLRLTKTNKTLGALHPIVVVKERGSGMQLRLVAGPINDAATAAKLCAGMAAADYFCETTLYDGQRLSMPAARSNRKRNNASLTLPEPEPPPPLPQAPTPPQQPHSALLSLLGVH
jgi:hypothetical protein